MKKIIIVCIAILMTASMVGCNATKTINETSSNILSAASSNLNSTGTLSDEEICNQLLEFFPKSGAYEAVIEDISGEVTLTVFGYHKELSKDGLLDDAVHWSYEKKKIMAEAIGWNTFIKTLTETAGNIQEYGEAFGIYKTRLAICDEKDKDDKATVFLYFENGRLMNNVLA